MYQYIKPVYSDQEMPQEVSRTLFLCGPSPREGVGENWRKKALEYLESIKYDGHIFIPLTSDGKTPASYDAQRQWEIDAIDRADCIVFWVPRNTKTLPGLTTNVEFGLYTKSGRVILGYPPQADKMTYLDATAKDNRIPVYHTLEETLDAAITFIGEGHLRSNGKELIPLFIYKMTECQEWLKSNYSQGNYLTDFRVKHVFNIPTKNILLYWFAETTFYLAKEKRLKSEFVHTRRGICSCVIHTSPTDILDAEIILVKEYRNTCSNEINYVLDLPGGGGDTLEKKEKIIIEEVLEETGVQLNPEQIKLIDIRQVSSTYSLHSNELFSYKISDEQMQEIKAATQGKVYGVGEDTEQTYVHIMSLREIMENKNIDWATLGLIVKALSI